MKSEQVQDIVSDGNTCSTTSARSGEDANWQILNRKMRLCVDVNPRILCEDNSEISVSVMMYKKLMNNNMSSINEVINSKVNNDNQQEDNEQLDDDQEY